MTDWGTVSALATAGGTLVLAAASFASIRSADRAARSAERAVQASLRPLLVASRLEDPVQKLHWIDGHWTRLDGSMGYVHVAEDGRIYLGMSIRNIGPGIGVIHGWRFRTGEVGADLGHPDLDSFRRQTRDLYIAPSDTGFWHAAVRDAEDPDHEPLLLPIKNRERIVLELLYGDYEGGQRTLSRFSLVPRDLAAHGEAAQSHWFCQVVRHWNIDRPQPR
ncbi:hypothetical protein [Streptacidiphilus albus]|uniref:hypothetical protein n=1 Tax=Streptacidiphilus albus TaxID=105425 RepID=UPI00054B1125|nr:hypothetical protein [Streptacidiphilus albus]